MAGCGAHFKFAQHRSTRDTAADNAFHARSCSAISLNSDRKRFAGYSVVLLFWCDFRRNTTGGGNSGIDQLSCRIRLLWLGRRRGCPLSTFHGLFIELQTLLCFRRFGWSTMCSDPVQLPMLLLWCDSSQNFTTGGESLTTVTLAKAVVVLVADAPCESDHELERFLFSFLFLAPM